MTFTNTRITHTKTKDWSMVPKEAYDLILWDLRYSNQSLDVIVGGRETCEHKFLEDNRCECGAFIGHILDASLPTYTEMILTLLASSPSKDLTIFLSPRLIHPESILKHPLLSTPKFKTYMWVSKLGSNYNKQKQGQLYLFVASKSGDFLPHSEILFNKVMFDNRLLSNYEKVLYINPRTLSNVMIGNNVDILTDQEFIYEKLAKTL